MVEAVQIKLQLHMDQGRRATDVTWEASGRRKSAHVDCQLSSLEVEVYCLFRCALDSTHSVVAVLGLFTNPMLI